MTLAVERDLFKEYKRATGHDKERLEEELVREHENLAHFVRRKYWSSQTEQEDLQQIAMLALLEAVRKFEPDRGMQFSTFAVKVIRGRILNIFRDQYRDKRKVEMMAFSIHEKADGNPDDRELLESIPDGSDLPEKVVEQQIMYEYAMNKAEAILTEKEFQAFSLRFADSHYQPTFLEISRELGVSETRANKLYRTSIEKLRTYFTTGEKPTKTRVFPEWRPAELQLIHDMLKEGQKRPMILEQFPHRSQTSIDKQISKIRKKMREDGLLI